MSWSLLFYLASVTTPQLACAQRKGKTRRVRGRGAARIDREGQMGGVKSGKEARKVRSKSKTKEILQK